MNSKQNFIAAVKMHFIKLFLMLTIVVLSLVSILSAEPIDFFSAVLLKREDFLLRPVFFIQRNRGDFDHLGETVSLPEDVSSGSTWVDILMQYGMTEKLELSSRLVYQSNFYRKEGFKEAKSSGLGESKLYFRYKMFADDQEKEFLTGLFLLKVPSGKFENANPDFLGTDIRGTGSYDWALGLNATKFFNALALYGDVIFTIPVKTHVDSIETEYGPYITYDCAGEYFFKNISFLFEVNGFLQASTKLEGTVLKVSNSRYMIVSPGIGWSNKGIKASFGYRLKLSGVNTSVTESVVFALGRRF